LTWDLEQLLSDRPVQRGQALLSVGDTEGEWIVELETPGDQIGYVLEAMQDESNPPIVTFEMTTERGRQYDGRITRIATRTELNSDGHSMVRLTVHFMADSTAAFRPGATVFARISCGQRSIGYVYLHDIIDATRTWIKY
jgi:hypothetical protein